MIKYSRQRECIVNFLASRTDHPTAETIYLNTKKDFPNISLGTVYRNLSLLEEIGEIIKKDIEYGRKYDIGRKQRVQKLGFAVEERYTPCTG